MPSNLSPLPSDLTGHPAMRPPTASPERLAKAHQLVTLHNTDPAQTFIFQDRYWRHVAIEPDRKVEIDMLVDEIANLVYQGRTDRGFYDSGPKRGQPFPAHPVKVIGIPTIQTRPPSDRELSFSNVRQR
jgi:hypothetical protein